MKMDSVHKRVVVTGPTGFIGKNLLRFWEGRYNLQPVSFSHTPPTSIDIEPGDTVIHLAGIAHQPGKTDPSIYFDVNYKKAVAFAIHAKAQGAAHFIFMSTTKVYGANASGLVITEDTACHPEDAYGQSKLKAEEDMRKLASPEFTVSAIRPPLVYGAGVKGNMLKLLRLTASGKPLPFKGVRNERSLVYVGNLLAMTEAIMEQGKEGVFIPADDKPLSTFQILHLMKEAMHTSNKEVGVPSWFTKLVTKVRPTLGNKLFGTLVYDNSQSREKLQFTNPYTTAEGFADMVNWFQKQAQKI